MPDPFRVDDALLATCAAEPIHVPGAVQTHGLLLVLSPDLHVEQAAGAALLDLPPAALPGRDLAAHVSASLAGAVRASLPTLRSGAPRDLGTYLLNGVDLDVSLHRHEGLILLELIPRGTRAPGLGVTIDSGMVITELLDTLGRGELADLPIEALCAQVAERFRSFSGYDRVMVYRFDAEWNGEVVAEAGPEPDGRFLGLCFPASDIPPQARDLYLRLRLRVLADVAADPAPLYPTLHPRTGGPLDLTYAQLRALSPVHREYLGNMGVQATLVVSIVLEGRLWGLLSCHHYSPRVPDAPTRILAQGLVALLAAMVRAHEQQQRALGERWAQALLDTLRTRVLSMQDLGQAIIDPAARFQEIVAADGLAVVMPAGQQARGIVPAMDVLDGIVTWLDEHVGAFYVSDHLAAEPGVPAGVLPAAAGLLALRLPGFVRAWVMWFRSDSTRAVRWGGDPRKGIVTDPGGVARLTPRASFETWLQTVEGRARPWTIAERAMVSEAVRTNLLDVVVSWQRRQAEALEAHYSHLLSQVHDAIIVLDAQGVVTFWSAGAAEIFGWSAAERLGRPLVGCLSPGFCDYLRGQIGAVATGPRISDEVEFERPDGRRLLLDLHVDRVVDAQGRGTAFVIIARDATQRRHLEMQLRQAAKMEAVGGLAGGIAHDFNNLLTVVTGFSALVLKSLSEEAPERWMVQEIASTGQRGMALTQQMLAFSRRQLLQPETFDLNAAVRSCSRMLERLIGEDVRLQLALSDGGCAVHVDRGQLDQVLVNLAVNARDAMPTGGQLTFRTAKMRHDGGEIRSGVRMPAGEYVCLSVEDTGVGMDEGTLAKVFEPFFTTKESGKGTGLGLSVVYGVVNQSQGFIAVESAPGRGTVFFVYLPLVGPVAGPAGTVAGQALALGRGETVLVVEDEPGVRSLACLLLREHGYRVLEAAHPGEALELASQAATIDLLLSDVVMPEMQGPEVAERLSRALPDLRVLLMSGYPGDEMVRRGLVSEGIDLLHKPFTPAVLLERVRAALDGAPFRR
ncbi:ATP-binding protein [Luteitalea sp.]|uniref:ATP-binding protein n=1 Tax=Luteitalea sp. TaxID=2004800 RepID=UPI0037C64A22